MESLFVTLALAFGLFSLVGLMLALKVLFRRTTPLKAHACEVMCKHGKNQACVCDHDEPHECSDGAHPKPRP
jgi:hypothetical protein